MYVFSKFKARFGIAIGLLIVMTGFQNCSEMKFSNAGDDAFVAETPDIIDPNDPNPNSPNNPNPPSNNPPRNNPPVVTPPVVVNPPDQDQPSDESEEETDVAKIDGDCRKAQNLVVNDPITVENNADIFATGGSRSYVGEKINLAQLTGGSRTVNANSINVLQSIGGTLKVNALSIGIASLKGGTTYLDVDSLNGLGDFTGGTMCVKTAYMGSFMHTGGSMRLEGKNTDTHLDTILGITGGYLLIRNFSINKIDSPTGGSLFLENVNVKELHLGYGGKIHLKNSTVGVVFNSKKSTQLVVENSTVAEYR